MFWKKQSQIETLRRQLRKTDEENRRLNRDLHNLRIMLAAQRRDQPPSNLWSRR